MTTTDRRRTRPIPPHGTPARYTSRKAPCRCDDCRRANSEAWRRWNASRKALRGDAARGDDAVPTGPVVDHLTRLRQAGVTDAELIRATGVPRATLEQLRNRASVRARTADAILAVPVPDRVPPPTRDPGWRLNAACARHDDPELWQPTATTPRRHVDEARRICRTCPVRGDCLDEAIVNDETEGIWGGHTLRERRAITRAREAS